MTDPVKLVDELVETYVDRLSDTGPVADAVLSVLRERAEHGDHPSHHAIYLMARDGLVAKARRVSARQRIVVRVGEAAFKMRRRIGVRRAAGYQQVMWQLAPIEELREYRDWLSQQIAVSTLTFRVIDFGIRMAEKHATTNVREALLAEGLNPDEFAIEASR